MLLRIIQFLLVFLFAGVVLMSLIAQTTTLVTKATDGKLTYKTDAVGSVIPDYSDGKYLSMTFQ